jgi:uncharacterized protein
MPEPCPSVGLLFNGTSPQVLRHAAERVQHLSVMPNQLWLNCGDVPRRGQRFLPLEEALADVRQALAGRTLVGHGMGLSLPSAMPLDTEMAAMVAAVGDTLGGFAWYSEHLSLVVAPGAGAANSDVSVALPVACDEEALVLVAGKLRRLGLQMGCRLLLENSAFFTPIPEMEMGEPEFLNRLHAAGLCGTLLDLHNLVVSSRNDGGRPEDYLERLDLDSVEEVHLAGGDDFHGFYIDSHSTRTPEEVWELAAAYLPRCRNLRAITFEYQESYHELIGLHGVLAEIERMHELAATCHPTPEPCHAR